MGSRGRASLVLLAAFGSGLAYAAPGYELDATGSSFPVGGELAHGIAVDQASQLLYVSVGTTNLLALAPGRIEQFGPSGVPTAESPFTTGESDYFATVAVNPLTHHVYAYQTKVKIRSGQEVGSSRMNTFSPSGLPGPSFAPPLASGPHIAADSAGRIFFPNDLSDTVEVFDSGGAPKTTIACGGCPGGAFDDPASVALDAADNLYVAEFGGRAIKFVPVGGSYVYDSTLQSGQGAVAVAVDQASGEVFVGDFGGDSYHVAAFDSAGVQFDDFGKGTISDPPLNSPGQIAVNATTHRLYVTDPAQKRVWMFERVASIQAPAALTEPAAGVGQLSATLKAMVKPKGHGLTECRFEYLAEADLQAGDGPARSRCPAHPASAARSTFLSRATSRA